MLLQVQPPISYLITNGATNAQTTPASESFAAILRLVEAAVAARVSFIQLREKLLPARILFELTLQATAITRGSQTRLLVNDRADIARGAGASGVHLTSVSLSADVVREAFGPDFIIGVSTHSLEQAQVARDHDANFAVWGPVFVTESKNVYGAPQGVDKLASLARELAPFPILALGGIKLDNIAECFKAGAIGIAGISIFQDRASLEATVANIHKVFQDVKAQ